MSLVQFSHISHNFNSVFSSQKSLKHVSGASVTRAGAHSAANLPCLFAHLTQQQKRVRVNTADIIGELEVFPGSTGTAGENI